MDRITYGSLEARAEQISKKSSATQQSKANESGVSLESLMRGGDMMHVDNDGEMTEEQQNLMQELENKRRARGIPVPTDDAKVRQFLRMLSEPITLFGEGPFERRERLRLIMARRDDRELTNLLEPKETAMDESDDENEEFFTEGGEALENARRFFVDCSLRNARKRSDICSQIFSTVSANDWRNHLKNTYKSVSTFELAASQIAATRPLSTCAFSPDGSQLITGCFDGKLKMFKIPDCSEAETKYQGHQERVSGVSWHPEATIGLSEDGPNFASGGADGSVHLWSLKGGLPVVSLEGHSSRVSSTSFHGSGRYLGTAGFDMCWKLWDLETVQELLLQEGHSREVYCIRFQNDGSLAASGGFDKMGRVWDLRTGRSIMLLRGHTQSVVSMDFSPNCYEIATGSADNSIRIHDIRKLKQNLHLIPAHTNLVSSVKYCKPGSLLDDISAKSRYFADYLVSSSFDGSVKVFSIGDYKPLKILKTGGANEKLFQMDVCTSGEYIAAASYDRTFKLWSKAS